MSAFSALGDVVSFIGGGTPDRKNEDYWGGPIPWATVKDFNSGNLLKNPKESITDIGLKSSAANLIKAGTLIIPTRMALGKAAIASVDMAINQDLKAVIPNKNLDTKYLLLYFFSNYKKIEEMGKGATVKGVTLDQLRQLRINIPTLEEQRRIAAILDKAEALRAKRREAIVKLDQLLQSVFLEMFGDPVTNNKNWREDKLLGDVADICSGITKGRKTTSETKLIPYLAVANVQDKFLKVDVVKEIEATEDEIEKYKLKKHDLLLTEGGDPDKLGRGSLWHDEIPLCIHQNHVFRVRLNNKEINPIYLNWLVGSYRGKRYFLSVAKQTTGIASINLGQLKKFPLLIPPLDLQEKFAKIEEAVRKKYMLEQKISLEKIDALIGSIQASYF